jgi:hypothetical protein
MIVTQLNPDNVLADFYGLRPLPLSIQQINNNNDC